MDLFREAEKVAEKLCAKSGNSQLNYLNTRFGPCARLLLENTARHRNRGTSLYETLSGKPYACQGFCVKKVGVGLWHEYLEKTIKGSIGLEMTWVTPLSLPMVEDFSLNYTGR